MRLPRKNAQGSFDSADTSLREVPASLKMTSGDRVGLTADS